jgi:hypothetical protein
VIGPSVLAALRDLDFEVDKHGASGTYAGRRVDVSVSRHDNVEVVVARAPFVPHLDLGLSVVARSFVPLFGEPEASTGDASLDAQYVFTCDERRRLRALMVPELAAALNAAFVAGEGIGITDEHASLPMMGSDSDPSWIEHVLDRVTEVAQRVDEARGGVPAPAALADHAEAVSAWARRRGLAFGAAPLEAHGDVDGRVVSIRASRAARCAHRFAVRARFEADLGVGLSLRREGKTAGIARFFGKHDVELGDAAFDARFAIAVDGGDLEARRLFDAELRAVLLDADTRLGEVRVDDAGIHVAAIEPDAVTPAALVELAEAIADGALRLERAARGEPRDEGPYR